MFQWNPEMVYFMRNACQYGDYHRQLVRWMLPYLHRSDHICDAGCGLGYLSLALAPHVRRVTAADCSREALAVLRESCKAQQLRNLCIQEGDIFSAPPGQPYDAMVFSFFGRMEEIAAIAKAQCRKTIFAFKKNYATHRFSVERHPVGDDNFQVGVQWLADHGVPFIQDQLELEMGQPFRSMAEAKRFFEIYSKDADPGLITPDFLQEKLTETGKSDFPLYLPHKRSMGCLLFSAEDL